MSSTVESQPLEILLAAQVNQGWSTGKDSADNVVIAVLVTVIVYFLGALIEKLVYMVSWAIGGPKSAMLGKRVFSNVLSTVVTANRWLTVVVHYFLRKCGFGEKAEFLVVLYPRGLYLVKAASIFAVLLLFTAEFGAIFLTNIKSYTVVFGSVGALSVAGFSLGGAKQLDTLTSCNDVLIESANIVYFESSIQIRSCHLNNYVTMPVFAGTQREVRFFAWPSVLEMRLKADNVSSAVDQSSYLKVELELTQKDFVSLHSLTDGMQGLSIPFSRSFQERLATRMPEIVKQANPSCTLTPQGSGVPIPREFIVYESETPEIQQLPVYGYAMNITCTQNESLSSTMAYMSRNVVFQQADSSAGQIEIIGELCGSSADSNCVAYCSDCQIGVEGQRYFSMAGFVIVLIVVFVLDSLITMVYKYMRYKAVIILRKLGDDESDENDSGLGAHLESGDEESPQMDAKEVNKEAEDPDLGVTTKTSELAPAAAPDRSAWVAAISPRDNAVGGSPCKSPHGAHKAGQRKRMPSREDFQSESGYRFGLRMVDYNSSTRSGGSNDYYSESQRDPRNL